MSATTNNTGDVPIKKEDELDENANSDSDEESNQKSQKKEKVPAKSNVKPTTNKSQESDEENNHGDDDDDDEEEEEEEEKKPGLLDLPLEVSGSRERKKVERLHLSFKLPSKEKKTDIPEGLGQRLGECPRIEMNLQKMKVDDLKLFHRVLFNRQGTSSVIKKNIKRFSGFLFAKGSAEYEKKRSNIDKLRRPELKQLCEILDLERGGTKEEVVTRILTFLMKPTPSEKSLPKSKSKKSSPTSKKSGSKKTKNSKEKNTKRKSSDLDSGSNDDGGNSVDEENDNDGDDKADDRDDEKMSDDDSEGEKKPKKKEKKAPAKPRGKTAKKEDKTTTKSMKKRKVVSSDDDDSSDDEPLFKKGKQPPTDEELKTYIKSILDGANLEEITMKTVCKQVFSHYPDFDLSSRKEFIKSTVRSIIS